MSAQNLDPGQYFPCFQPIIDLVTGHIEGYEALARYRDQTGQLRSAGALFHSQGPDQDSILAIDRQIRTLALQHFAEQPEAGYLTLNISPDWIDRLRGDTSPTIAMIDASGIDPHRVVIEITEGRGDLKQIERVVSEYRNAGLRVAIDDFGAGASQVDRIIALKPDLIKLDMRMFKDAAQGGIGADVTLAAADIAQRVGCDIVCEGVETEPELHFGIECGARYIQGFIFHPALERTLAADQELPAVRRLQASFLKRKTELLRNITTHNHRIRNQVMNIRQHLAADRAQELSAPGLFQNGILRYYLCRPDGTQISDNIEVRPDRFEHHPGYRQYNWSHRPYFPLLVALDTSLTHRVVASDSYRDSTSDQMCKTYATCIRDDLILLVDVTVDDEVLYAS